MMGVFNTCIDCKRAFVGPAGLCGSCEAQQAPTHVYHWGNTPERAARKGQRCRILARGARQSILVEFEDGHQMVTSMRAVRRIHVKD